ncbi:hypothetical protein A2W24_06560 [Microgenomates group bacterium RBG_16_45_19]|nr:MAG: hypothetical protein A2W24_06560 [Microgenomates group bacterium RBG_16_45_19]
MRRLIIVYNLILTLVITLAAVFNAKGGYQLLYGLLFLPIAFYFIRVIGRSFSRRRVGKTKSIRPRLPSATLYPAAPVLEGEALDDAEVKDLNRRMFLKLIGSAGLATFVFALFSKSAHAAFFGSVPGPGTVALKDTAGNKIDPAEKHPTDGYEISQVDDSTIPAYYGFLNKNGAWYIAREGNSGEYRYARGATDFSSYWGNHTGLSYSYFNLVFGS